MKIKVGIIALAIAAATSATAHAKQTSDPSAEKNAGLSKVDIAEARKMTKARSDIRNKDDITTLETNAISKKLNKVNMEGELAERKFIVENVPVDVRIQGEAAIVAYVEKNFNQPEYVKAAELTEVWSSSTSSMYIPQVAPQERGVEFSLEPSSTDIKPLAPEQTPDITTSSINTGEQEAMDALGITKADLEHITGKAVAVVREEPEPIVKEVVLTAFSSDSHVVSGDYRRADVTVNFSVKENGRVRTVERKVTNVKVGTQFRVEDESYIIIDINPYGVTIRHTKNGQTYNSEA